MEKPDDRKLIESAINGNIAEALGIHVARMRIEPGQPVRWGRGICMLPILTTGRGFATTQTENVMQVQTRGEFGGLGIEVTMEDGLIKVVAPIDETGTKSTVATGEDPAHAPSILELRGAKDPDFVVTLAERLHGYSSPTSSVDRPSRLSDVQDLFHALLAYFNDSISNYVGSPSYSGVENVKGVVASALVRL